MDPFILISSLEAALTGPLPGIAAHNRMSPSHRRTVSTRYVRKDGGVLILLYPSGGSLFTVFMKRTEYEGAHSGQISFPGGIREAHDPSMTATALREAEEETGIIGACVRILGALTPLHIPVSNILVYPAVGYVSARPDFRIDKEEVQFLIEASLDTLMDPSIIKSHKMIIQEKEMDVPYFDIQGHVVWGATAMILGELLEVLKSVTGH